MEDKNTDDFLAISSDELDEENPNNNNINKNLEKDNYHNLFKGINSESFNFKIKDKTESKKEKEKEEKNKNYILKLREKLNNNTKKKKDKKLLILPPPENDLFDNHYNNNLLDDEELNKNKLAKLMNPDNISIKKNEDLDLNNDIINNEKNIISINQKDILDNNWEIKYINKMLKKDMKEAIKKEEEIQNEDKNKNKEGKKRKRDKKNNEDDDDIEEGNIKSKYSKISTKRKYGW